MELKTSSSFKTTGLLQPWQTLCKIFSKCLTTRVTRWDQPPLQIMKMMRPIDKVDMQIPDWMIIEEMKQTEHYRMCGDVFGLDVPLTLSQPTESTQGMHRTPSALVLLEHKRIDEKSKKLEKMTVLVNLALGVEEIEKMLEGIKEIGGRYKLLKCMNSSKGRKEACRGVKEYTHSPTLIRSPRIHTNLVSSDTEKLQELTVPSTKLSKTNRLLSLFKAKPAHFK
ncbi:hypothetical protein Tco_0353205 [Tanacetum coccineum]